MSQIRQTTWTGSSTGGRPAHDEDNARGPRRGDLASAPGRSHCAGLRITASRPSKRSARGQMSRDTGGSVAPLRHRRQGSRRRIPPSASRSVPRGRGAAILRLVDRPAGALPEPGTTPPRVVHPQSRSRRWSAPPPHQRLPQGGSSGPHSRRSHTRKRSLTCGVHLRNRTVDLLLTS
jgi:hypothetical protein